MIVRNYDIYTISQPMVGGGSTSSSSWKAWAGWVKGQVPDWSLSMWFVVLLGFLVSVFLYMRYKETKRNRNTFRDNLATYGTPPILSQTQSPVVAPRPKPVPKKATPPENIVRNGVKTQEQVPVHVLPNYQPSPYKL